MRYQPFKEMKDQELIDIYPVYQSWNDTGFIPENSVFAVLRDEYSRQFGSSSILLMERDYLRECTERFANPVNTEKKEDTLENLLDELFYARVEYNEYVNRNDGVCWSEEAQQKAYDRYYIIKEKIISMMK